MVINRISIWLQVFAEDADFVVSILINCAKPHPCSESGEVETKKCVPNSLNKKPKLKSRDVFV